MFLLVGWVILWWFHTIKIVNMVVLKKNSQHRDGFLPYLWGVRGLATLCCDQNQIWAGAILVQERAPELANATWGLEKGGTLVERQIRPSIWSSECRRNRIPQCLLWLCCCDPSVLSVDWVVVTVLCCWDPKCALSTTHRCLPLAKRRSRREQLIARAQRRTAACTNSNIS